MLALALAAFTGGLWAGVTSSFGVNFRTAEAQDIPADTAAGFAKGDYMQPTTWANLNGGNGKQDITVGGATLNVTWYSRGTWDSGADTSTLDGKLLYNFLDDTVNSGRQKAAVKITGLPADKQYTVALILSGDADNDGFNGKYSPVWMNGQIYSYNAEATLLTGADAVAARTWGSRRKPSAGGPSTFIEGTNVMFVEGVTGSELIITSAMDSQNVSRLTIAGVQVWVTDTTVTAPAVTAPTDSDVISVNFHTDDGAAADGNGLVAAKHWHNTTGATGTIDSLTVVNGDDSVASSGTLTYKSKNTWGYGDGVADNFLKGYLDDGAHDNVVGATITATVPFETYSVIVYMATDTAGQFKPVIINGTLYAGSATLSSVGYADAKPSMMQNTSVCNWGASQTATAVYGTNALRVDGLSGDLSIQAGNDQTYNGIRNRGGIAAIQIVNTGDSILTNVQKIDWSDKTAEELKVSELPELTKPEVELTLSAGATLIVDTALPADHSFVIVGDNATVHITNWDIDKSDVDAVVSGATVTTAYTDTIGVEIDGVTYSYYFRGTTDANYHTVANWYTGKRVMGDQTKWYSVSGEVAPGVGGNMWHYMLLDGDMMDPANVTVGEDGYKTISANTLEGWNLGYFVRNGVHLNVATLNKIQNGGGFTAVWRVDDTSKITIGARGNSTHNNLANYYVDNEEGMVFSEFDIADANYYFDEDGSVKLDGVSGTQTIKAIKLDLGTVAEGRKVVSRKVIGFNSSTATYTVEEGAVTTSVEAIAATEAVSLRNVGDYKFEQKEDGYYVSFVAYAATDEIGEVSTWTATEDTTWATEGNWTFGVPEAGADAIISIAADTTITIPAEGVTVGVLTVNGEGTLTIAGGKLTAGEIFANTSIAADETTLALAPMNIEAGKTVTYTTTTATVDPDGMGASSHALSLKAMTGAGTFVKKGTGVIGLFATAAEPVFVVEEGAFYVREAPTTAMNIAAKTGAEIRLAAWHVDFANTANKFTLDGGAQLTLANGANVYGTITIENAAETAAKICGSSFNDSTIAAAITGAGKVEFADGGSFADATKFPCDNATTYSGVISGDLQVIISDTSAVTFTGANTYTGGTVIAEGVTVTVSNLTSIFGTGDITGAGTVKIAGGTYNGLSFAQYTDANTTIVIPANNTVTGYFNNATWTCAAKIQLDGALEMTNGFAAGKYTFTGPWAGAGAFSLSNAAPPDVVRITGDISDFTGNISIAGARALTFCAATTGTNQKYAGKICVHGDYAYTAKVNGTWSAPVMVENGAKIGGTGTIDNTLTFANGAIIDTSITATGDVTLNGTVTVSGEAGAIVLTCANAESLDLTKFAAPAGLKCVAENGAVKLAVAKVNVTIPAAPANTKWYDADGNVVEAGTIAVDPNTDVTLTLKADDGKVFADGSTSKDYTVNSGENGAEIATPDVTAATPVARVNGTKYQTLDAAIAAAGADDEVILIADIELTTFVTITKSIALNLNDYSINRADGTALYVNDDKVEVTIRGVGSVSGAQAVYVNAGTVAIENGNFHGYNGGHAVYVQGTGKVEIIDGTFSIDEAADSYNYVLNKYDADRETASIVVMGGKFKGFNPANNGAEGAGTNFCDEDFAAIEGEGEDAGYYVVVDAVAKIGNVGYATFDAAWTAAEAGETITLLAPVTITSDTTIDLAGKNITSDGDVFIVTAGTLTINGEGNITANTDNAGTANAVWADGGAVVINGGTWSCGGDDTETTDVTHQNDTIYTKHGGTVTITAGTFEYTEGVWTLNENDQNRGTISVTGGKFKNFNPADNTSEGANTNFCAEGYEATEDADGYWTVAEVPVSTNVAKIGDTEYATLQAAFEAAATMTGPVTVTLLSDVGSEAEAVSISIPECNDEITFDMGGFKVVGGIDTYYSAKVTIKNGTIESYNSDYPIHAKKGHIVLRDITLWSKSAHGVRLEGSEDSRITCEIYSGNYDSNGSGYTIYARNYSDLIIYGGTFTDGTHCVNVQSTNTGKIYGGSFTGIVYAPVDTQLMMVYGGKFTGTTYLTLGTGYGYTSKDSEGFISVVKADYALTVNAENATVSALNATYQYEDEVSFTVTPAAGYKVTSVKLGEDELTADEDGNYSFSMPAKAATITVTTEAASTFDVMIGDKSYDNAEALKAEAKAGVEMTIPATGTWTAEGNVLKKDGEAYVTFADYYTVVVNGTSVTLKLNKPVIGDSAEGADDAFTVTADAVTIKITNYNSALKYGVRIAADINSLSSAEITVLSVANGNITEDGVITLEKSGDSAFYEVVVSDVDFPTTSAE